ncbi:hypothetical protein LAZ67_11002408 [Cordylochernes scorpioides]|uniref:Transposase n=1 Tax=Cordylochernes scorpioides TaxID=51811 RepID=A0ABY6KZY9_9ARAC|nr:hypothetical protein LAZ67_11002408 [Cordylochernes scorpioides]
MAIFEEKKICIKFCFKLKKKAFGDAAFIPFKNFRMIFTLPKRSGKGRQCALKDLKDGKTMTGYFTSVMRGPHTAHVVLQFLAKHSTIQIPHPPYSPDLAPNDFFLYTKLKMNLKRRKFDNVDMIQAESKATLRNLSKSDFISCFDNWKKRWNGCIEAGGAYLKNIDLVFLFVLFFQRYRAVLEINERTLIEYASCIKTTKSKESDIFKLVEPILK